MPRPQAGRQSSLSLKATSESCHCIAPPHNVRRSKRLEQRRNRSANLRVSQRRSHLPSPESDERFEGGLKRKRIDSTKTSLDNPLPKKKARVDRASIPVDNLETTSSKRQYDPIQYWAEHETWPSTFAANPEMGDRFFNKRSRSRSQSRSSSYTQGVRDGEYPAPWTRQHEERMQEAGLIMAEYRAGVMLDADCRHLCDSILKAEYPLPDGPFTRNDRLLDMLDRVRFRNEARVFRDITPLIVPSAELLDLSNQANLKHITEAINAEWIQCNTLCGPKPKPDFAAGIAPSAFTKEEREKLQLTHTSASPSLFPEKMYFPAIICEVKGSDRPIQEAERQAMHSASLAAQAVIQLYKRVGRVSELNCKLLSISVAHNNSTVKFFGHFATITEENTTFYRHRIFATDFAADFASRDWAKPFNITRGIYDIFFPRHLERIKSALVDLRGRALESFTSQLGLDGSVDELPRGATPSSASSKESGPFKKPSRSSVGQLQQENERLRNELRKQEGAREKQLAQQMEMMERQLAQQEAQIEEQREQKDTMERQLAQQKEEQRKQEDAREKQLAQQQEIIDLLKQIKS